MAKVFVAVMSTEFLKVIVPTEPLAPEPIAAPLPEVVATMVVSVPSKETVPALDE